jgi:two-component system chemotaxis sensor kinase CheA
LRNVQLALDGEITTALLTMVDAVRQMLTSIETSGLEGERDDSALISELTRLQRAEPSDKGKAQELGKSKVAAAAAGAGALSAVASVKVATPGPNSKHGRIEGGGAEEGKAVVPRALEDAIESAKEDTKEDAKKDVKKVDQAAPRPAETSEGQPAQQAAARAQSAGDSTIRLDVSLLDHLMNLVGELVLARNQILQCANSTEESTLLAASQRLNLITTEFQGGVMKTRMQPIGNIWSKLPRTVRDLALDCGKQVRVEMEGKETELDKTLIEAIKDPLTHLVRNSVDHGIERPEVRQAAGKNPEGLLSLRAFHEGGQVNIEITDDGAGLDQERIRNKALEKGLVTAEQAGRMTEREIVNLILLPGFSTAEKLTKVSGRGVGMDVVKTHIERIGGTIDVQSKTGKGVMVRMKIPLTLAIIPARHERRRALCHPPGQPAGARGTGWRSIDQGD